MSPTDRDQLKQYAVELLKLLDGVHNSEIKFALIMDVLISAHSRGVIAGTKAALGDHQ